MFLIVRTVRKTDHIVVVVKLKNSAEETKAEMERVKAELVEFIKGRFSETQYPKSGSLASRGRPSKSTGRVPINDHCS